MVCNCVRRDNHCDRVCLPIDPALGDGSHPDLDIASEISSLVLVDCRSLTFEKYHAGAAGNLHQDCVIGDVTFPRPDHLCRIDPHLCDFVWMKSMSCLQVMVSAYPRGEPLLQA